MFSIIQIIIHGFDDNTIINLLIELTNGLLIKDNATSVLAVIDSAALNLSKYILLRIGVIYVDILRLVLIRFHLGLIINTLLSSHDLTPNQEPK